MLVGKCCKKKPKTSEDLFLRRVDLRVKLLGGREGRRRSFTTEATPLKYISAKISLSFKPEKNSRAILLALKKKRKKRSRKQFRKFCKDKLVPCHQGKGFSKLISKSKER